MQIQPWQMLYMHVHCNKCVQDSDQRRTFEKNVMNDRDNHLSNYKLLNIFPAPKYQLIFSYLIRHASKRRPRTVINMHSNSANLHARSKGLSYRVAKVTRKSEVLACLAPQNGTIINDVMWYKQQWVYCCYQSRITGLWISNALFSPVESLIGNASENNHAHFSTGDKSKLKDPVALLACTYFIWTISFVTSYRPSYRMKLGWLSATLQPALSEVKSS
jgi:hypothetical protein